MFSNDLILENDTVILRPLVMNDVGKFSLITTEKDLWTYFTSDLAEKLQLNEWITDALSQKEHSKRLPFTIVEKTTGKIAGSTSFGNISFKDKRLEIGWTWLGKDFQGSGLNRNCKSLLLNYAFEALQFERVEFKTDVLNAQARKALQKIGAIEEGVLRSHTLMTGNRRRDTIYYSILDSEWQDTKQTHFADLINS